MENENFYYDQSSIDAYNVLVDEYNIKRDTVMPEFEIYQNIFGDYLLDVKDYKEYLAGQKEYAQSLTPEIAETQKEITALNRTLDILKKESNRIGVILNPTLSEYYQSQIQKTESQIAEQGIKLEELHRTQMYARGSYYSSFIFQDDFALMSKAGTGDYGDATHRHINDWENQYNWEDIPASRRVLNPEATFGALSMKDHYGGYGFITDDERDIYNYLYNTKGAETANEYIDYLKETLNYRYGQNMAESVKDSPFLQYTMAAPIALEGWGQDFVQLFSNEALPTSAKAYANQQIREDLGSVGPQFFGNSTGQLGYDLLGSVTRMAPTLLFGAVNPILGAGLTGLSSAGGAYGQALKEGMSVGQARLYSSLVGAAEGGMQYVLGGISYLGGIADDVLLAKVQGIKSALPRVALTAGIKIGSEVLEENLQFFIEPAIRKLILGTPYQAPTWEEMAYTTILTALTTGAIEGGNIAKSGTCNPSQNTPTIQPPGQTAPAGGLYGTGDSGNMGARSGIGPEWQAYIDYGVDGILGTVEGAETSPLPIDPNNFMLRDGESLSEYMKRMEVPQTFSDKDLQFMDDIGLYMQFEGEGNVKLPKAGSLSDLEARNWYLDQEAKIPNLIDKSQPLEQQARQASGLRNQFRTQAREAMSNRPLAEQYNITDKNLTWDEMVKKYSDQGFTGDALYEEIIKASIRSRASVNEALGIYRNK